MIDKGGNFGGSNLAVYSITLSKTTVIFKRAEEVPGNFCESKLIFRSNHGTFGAMRAWLFIFGILIANGRVLRSQALQSCPGWCQGIKQR